MFSKNDLAQKGNFLDKTKAEREKRMHEKHRDASATKIQVSSVVIYVFTGVSKDRLDFCQKL